MSLGARYILGGPEGHTPIRCDSLAIWKARYTKSKKWVAEASLNTVWVSTSFLGVDRRREGKGPPLVFETLVIPWETENIALPETRSRIRKEHPNPRYATWDDAVAGHLALCRRYRRFEIEGMIRLYWIGKP